MDDGDRKEVYADGRGHRCHRSFAISGGKRGAQMEGHLVREYGERVSQTIYIVRKQERAAVAAQADKVFIIISFL